MAQSRSSLDEFNQYAVLGVAGVAAASGIELEQLQTGITNQQKIAWEVNRIEYSLPDGWWPAPSAQSDYIMVGVTQSGSATQDFSPRGASVIDLMQWGFPETPAAYGSAYLKQPFIHDFGVMARLVLPQMLYAFVVWDTTQNISTARLAIRMYYKEREITKEDWYDLLQLRLPLGAT